jgi:3-methyladenine DNA glycosylase AlkD
MSDIIEKIRIQLDQNGDEKIQQATLRFFKEEIQCYGLKSATVTAISNEYFKLLKGCSKEEIFGLCEQLWQSKFIEENMIACSWSLKMKKHYQMDDFELFKRWIDQYITNWATCDTFCNHNMGSLIEIYPELLPSLKEFTTSSNRWMKRAAAVSLIVPARKGLFLEDIFDIANAMLMDPDDMVQKGYGWMLKVASQKHLQEVYDFVIKNKSVMLRTSLRYAIEKMPADLKQQAMLKD